MKNIEQRTKPWKIASVALALLTLTLFSTMASAKMDVNTDQLDENLTLVVNNSGDSPAYMLNAFTVLNENGEEVYSSQEPSEAELLRINPNISYTFEKDTEDLPEGNYTGKIYQGDDEKNLKEEKIDFHIKPRSGKLILNTDKKSYKSGKRIYVNFINRGFRNIYANVNNWKITDLDTGAVVYTLSQDCTFGYGDCANSFEPFSFREHIEQAWNQKDVSGHQVAPGRYMVTAEYSDNPSGSESKTISTNTFFIKPDGR